MIFTVYYAYATLIQWWRLRSLRNKLNGTLNDQNSLVVCSSGQPIVNDNLRKHRSLENLLFKTDNRIACTVVPKQKLNLSQWLAFPKNLRYFPIFISKSSAANLEETNGVVFILLQAVLDNYAKHQSEIIQVENFGELIAWKAVDYFEVILKTDLNCLTKLIHQFSQNDVDINHELKLLKIEKMTKLMQISVFKREFYRFLVNAQTIDIEGVATGIKYEKKYLKEQTLKYSYAPVHWAKFVQEVKDLYSKIRDITTPKIKIENGSTKCFDSGKPQKCKESKKTEEKRTLDSKKEMKKSVEDKNTLDVSSTSDYRRHKHDHKKTARAEPTSSAKGKHRAKHDDKQAAVEKPKEKKSCAVSTSKVLVKQNSVRENGSASNCEKKEQVSSAENVNVLPLRTTVKPPNVLVYADSVVTKDNVKRILFSILNKEKYTIYDLPTSKQTFWDNSTVLVVVCGSVPADLTSNLIQYLLSGGQLLCLCSDLMYSVLHTFITAEVREHELVRFSYGSWESVKMMHHIFCYQASPAKKQFSKDSDQSNQSSNGSSPLAPRTPSTVELRHNEKDYQVVVQVLGTEETWQTPSLLLAKVKGGQGRAVFSQVHLEIDPDEYENDEDKFESLQSSNKARIEIFKDILATHLELACDESLGVVEYTPGYFLGRFDAKMNMITDCDSITANQLACDKLSAVFCGHTVDPGVATNIRLPVLIHSCPSNFSTLEYFETLSAEYIGRLVIYSDILTSSQHLLTKKLRNGLVIIAKQQTNGLGRSQNTWISPMGSASFSLQLHIPLDTPMGKALPLIQHLIIVSIVSAINNNGYQVLNLGIKWPNDLYIDHSIKIGGIIVNSTIIGKEAIVNIGCGVNLLNQNPTVCLNDCITKANKENGTSLRLIPYEKYFAIVFNEIERLFENVQKNGVNLLFDLYYQYWLHKDANVTIQNENGDLKEAKIVGIDQFGFLTVQLTSDGTMTSVQPDGNSFDMMRGLIAPKSF